MDTRDHTTQSSPPYYALQYTLQGQEPSAEGRSPAAVHLSHKAAGKEDVASQLSTQRAAATKPQRAEVKLVTCAQLSDAGS